MLNVLHRYQLYPENIKQFYNEYNNGTTDTENQVPLKIMLILREPVSRRISWYNHMVYNARKKHRGQATPVLKNTTNNNQTTTSVKTFEEYATDSIVPNLDPQVSEWPDRGLYAHWLRKWFHLFDRSQILILSYDDLKRDPHDLLERLHAFLELPPVPKWRNSLWQANKRKVNDAAPIPCAVQERLAAAFEAPNQELYDLLEANPGPVMEKRPFPKFQFKCKEE